MLKILYIFNNTLLFYKVSKQNLTINPIISYYINYNRVKKNKTLLAGIEPATTRLTAECSNQLSYSSGNL
jgi:hypothetical protein